ncbi:hypothetical protein GLP30_08120 [Photobacterium phosphoreum]|uniref:Uncharacterized protein n=1 Tax=Photobacterium phosphoreum TaxID=659 RepID=A0AAW4ZIH2_PHOPO|nr:hypothetical protein [Photobacterium phosphoreum]MCD9481427.1 hypothetical protein [Photobacterium phosphoreum]MCD9484862.1 hypothetical protein [Photobacterium phosphoreum]MCD9490788.1 hypothetical protein [Photobacterium phosphoreum]MCD9503696.1 hypothetical protein [Photobacterium phosphoreum]
MQRGANYNCLINQCCKRKCYDTCN